MSDTKEIRVGIVGLGNIGRHHAERLDRLADEHDESTRLAGGVDIDRTARESFTDRFGVPVHGDVGGLLDGIDAAIVTTPNRFHEEYAVAAMEAGCGVLIEKPLAHSVESAERVAAAAEETGAVCMVGFHNRFTDPIEVLTSHIAAGRLGEIRHVEANYVRRRGVPGRGSWFTDRSMAGGGALVDIGTHALDLALHVMGFPPVREVTGVTRAEFGGREDYAYLDMWGDDDDGPFDVEDSATALVRCERDRTVALEAAWASNRQPTTEFVVRGTEAGAHYDLEGGDLTISEVSDDGAVHFADTEVNTRGTDPHVREQRYFIDHVRRGTSPDRNTIDQAMTVQRIVEGIYRSSEDGRAVTLGRATADAD